MNYSYKQIALAISTAFIMMGCVDNTGSLGISAEQDNISTSTDIFEITTRSAQVSSVICDNANAYLGKVIDPETGSTIEASCAQQFTCLENYSTPSIEQMIGSIETNANGDTISIEHGVVHCDSIEVRLFLKSYYGDDNTPMKLEVYQLDKNSVLQEQDTYYTDTDLNQYIAKDAKPLATKVFTPRDYTLTEAEYTDSKHNDNICVTLPRELGQYILEQSYTNPDGFSNSYKFIREVFPGLYFRISSGEGTMLTVMVSTVNIYFKYSEKSNMNKVYTGISRFAATPEVIQSTQVDNKGLESLLNDNSCTYLKTPAGICTEMTLPIDEIFDQHPNDSVSMASVTLTRYNKAQDDYQLGTPSSLLMVRKDSINSFFANRNVTNSRTSYSCTFNSTYNTYAFTNICRLLAYCKHEKIKGAQDEGITEEQWAAKHPNWNKVAIIPVQISTNTSGNQTSVVHDMNMNSVRLVGGDTKLQMQVIYSKFYQGK